MPDEKSTPKGDSVPDEGFKRADEPTSGEEPTRSVRRSVAIALGVGGFVVGVAVASIIALIFGGSSEHGAAKSLPANFPLQFPTAPQTAAPAQEVPAAGGVGQPVVNGGIKLTVNSVTTPPTISRRFENDVVRPRSGAKYVQVETTIENVGAMSVDLSCGLTVVAKVWDSQRRQFDVIDHIYDLPGNPDCVVKLQPGFSAKFTYAYEVPESAVIQYFGFTDISVNRNSAPSFISIAP